MDEDLRNKVHKLLDFFTEPGGERYLKDLENDLMALIASYTEKAYKKGFDEGRIQQALRDADTHRLAGGKGLPKGFQNRMKAIEEGK
jgi:hypothetical protein